MSDLNRSAMRFEKKILSRQLVAKIKYKKSINHLFDCVFGPVQAN